MSLQARKVPRLTAYGFEIGKDFCLKTSESTGVLPKWQHLLENTFSQK